MRRLRASMALLLAGALASCAALRSEDAPRSPAPRDTRVQVVNHGWSEMVIYVDRSGNRVRLGSVTSLSRTVLEIPPAIVRPGSSFRFLVSPIGSNSVHSTEQVQVSPGELLAFEIQDNLVLSTIRVRSQ